LHKYLLTYLLTYSLTRSLTRSLAHLLAYLLTYLLQFSCHSVAVVLTLVHTKQIRINIHKRNNTKNTVQTIQNTVNTSTHITKTQYKQYKTHSIHVHILPKHPHITKIPTQKHTHTLQNKLKQTQYKIQTQ